MRIGRVCKIVMLACAFAVPSTGCDSQSAVPIGGSEVATTIDLLPPPPVDAGQSPPPADAGQCSALSLVGAPTVTPTIRAMPVPAAQGGALVDGEYFLSELVYYEDGPGVSTLAVRQVSRFSGASNTTTIDVNGTVVSTDSAWSFSGTNVTIQQTCPQGSSYTPRFTATPTGFTLLTDAGFSVYTRK